MKEKKERNEEIKRLRFEERLSLQEIADIHKISRERVRQLIGFDTVWMRHKRTERKMNHHEKAWALVEKKGTDECWDTPSRKPDFSGFKRLSITLEPKKPHQYYIHRLVYEYIYGEIPKGACILQICLNPWCANPNHLFKTDRSTACTKKEHRHQIEGIKLPSRKQV
jgi:hypothetical protein